MKHLLALSLCALAVGGASSPRIPPGSYTNEEDRYFAQERKVAAVPEWFGIEVGGTGEWRSVDAFGKPLGDWRKEAMPLIATGERFHATDSKGLTTELRRAAQFKCWVSVRRHAAKPDGSPDWAFHSGLKLHNQGGRALVTDPAAPPVVIRLRDVVWSPPSTNKPSLVLYVHKPDDPDHAVSYAWADPKADLIGINLRWMQGSCSREETQP